MARILHLFAFMKDLVLSRHWVRRVASNLQVLTAEKATELRKCCPRYKAFSSRGNGHRDLDRGQFKFHCRATALRSSRGSPLVMGGLVVNMLEGR